MTISYPQQCPFIRTIIELSLHTTLRNLKERLDMWFIDCEEEHLSCRTGAQFYLRKYIDKIKHEKIGTYAGTEINQDADNADQKIKWFPKVHKTYKLLWEANV